MLGRLPSPIGTGAFNGSALSAGLFPEIKRSSHWRWTQSSGEHDRIPQSVYFKNFVLVGHFEQAPKPAGPGNQYEENRIRSQCSFSYPFLDLLPTCRVVRGKIERNLGFHFASSLIILAKIGTYSITAHNLGLCAWRSDTSRNGIDSVTFETRIIGSKYRRRICKLDRKWWSEPVRSFVSVCCSGIGLENKDHILHESRSLLRSMIELNQKEYALQDDLSEGTFDILGAQKFSLKRLYRASSDFWKMVIEGAEPRWTDSMVWDQIRGKDFAFKSEIGHRGGYPLLLTQEIGPVYWDFWFCFFTSLGKPHMSRLSCLVRNDAIAHKLWTRFELSQKPMLIVALYTMKLGPWDLPSDPAIIDKSKNGFISSAVHFLLSWDPVPALIASSIRSVPILVRDSGWAALAM